MSARATMTACMILAASPALAQEPFKAAAAKAVTTANYYQSEASANCASNGCLVYFPKIAKKKAVIFNRVSCVVTHASPIYLAGFGVAENKTDASLTPFATFAIPTSVSANGTRYSQFSQDVLLRMEGGDLPSVVIVTTAPGEITIGCVATGVPD